MLFAGLRPSWPLVAGAVFLMMLGVPIIQGCSQAIWQSKVEPDVQGRVFAVRRMVAQFTVPIADLSAGPLADYLFEPAMAKGGALAPVFGGILGGVGQGRGIGLLFLTIAAFPVAGLDRRLPLPAAARHRDRPAGRGERRRRGSRPPRRPRASDETNEAAGEAAAESAAGA